MGGQVQLWRVGADDRLARIDHAPLDLEARLQAWIAADVATLDPTLLVIGREVEAGPCGYIDLLCINADGDVVVVELKRGKTPRDVTAQALDYGSWVVALSNDQIAAIADAYLHGEFEDSFRERFGIDLPETLNSEHRILIVGSDIDAGSERIIRYLSETHGVNINAATFQYFRLDDGTELLARVFLIDPAEAALNTQTKGASRRRRPNLTYGELLAQATESGVRDLYEHALRALESLLQKHTTRSSIGFEHIANGSRKTVLSLLPGDSSAEVGLRYQAYGTRLADAAGIPLSELEQLLPAHEAWSAPLADDQYHWFEGYFSDTEAIDRVADALRHGRVAHRRAAAAVAG